MQSEDRDRVNGDEWEPITWTIWTFDEDHRVLVGRLVEKEPFEEGAFGESLRWRLVQQDGDICTFVGGSVLDRILCKLDLALQPMVRIEWCGTKELKGGRKCNIWKVATRKEN